MYYDHDQEKDCPDAGIIHSGLTYFPTFRHVLTLIIFAILEGQGIYLCVPLNRNSNISFFIGQIFLLAIIIYSWFHILDTVPGPMSELFNEDILKKAIEQGLNLDNDAPKKQKKICTNCQIERAAKTYHCDACNRCVYKFYFHSKWLNTCVSKENFPSFIAFLIFLDGYLIVLGVDNLIFFNGIWDENQQNFASFFFANPENVVISMFLFAITFFLLAVNCMIISTYYFAFRVRQSVAPVSCSEGCEGLKGKVSSNDKILHRIRSSIKQSTFMRLRQPKYKPDHGLFIETETVNAFDLIFKAFQKANIQKEKENQKNESNPSYPAQDTQKQLFTDLFGALFNLKKNQNEDQAEKQKNINGLNNIFEPKNEENMQSVQNMTKSKWKKYMKSTFEKGTNLKKSSQLAQAVEQKNQQTKNSSLSNTLAQIEKGSDSKRQFVMKKGSFSRRKLAAINNAKASQQKQNVVIFPNNNFKFTKKMSNLPEKLDDINEKESIQEQSYSKKSMKMKKQNDQESMETFSFTNNL